MAWQLSCHDMCKIMTWLIIVIEKKQHECWWDLDYELKNCLKNRSLIASAGPCQSSTEGCCHVNITKETPQNAEGAWDDYQTLNI